MNTIKTKTVKHTTTNNTTITTELRSFSTKNKEVIKEFLDYLDNKGITLESITGDDTTPKRKDINEIIVLDGADGADGEALDYIALNTDNTEIFCFMELGITDNYEDIINKLIEITFRDIKGVLND